MAEQSPLDALRSVLAGAARAMAHEPELELSFTTDAPSASLKQLRVPMPGRNLPREQVAEARGFADGFALRERHHDPRLHARGAPADANARAVFDAVEQARVEALGSRAMAGVRANLASALEMRLRSDPLTRARTRAEVPLASALGLIVRERLTGEKPPIIAEGGLALVRDWIEEKASTDLDALGLTLDDQGAFARLATRLLEDLELVEAQPEATDPEDSAGEEGDNVAVGQGREAKRPPDRVVRLRLPAVEVDRAQMRAGFEEEHVLAALGELAGDDPAARSRPDHDELVLALAHATPNQDQSFFRRRATGGSKSISAQAPGASWPGATKSE